MTAALHPADQIRRDLVLIAAARASRRRAIRRWLTR